MTIYQIREEPFTGSRPLPPYNNGGHYDDNQYTHAIYGVDIHGGVRLIFRAANRKHANTLLARLKTVHAIETATR